MYLLVMLMGQRSAACSIMQLPDTTGRNISAQITIHSFNTNDGKQTSAYLDVEEIKSPPHVPMSHPFVERLIASVRRELLDHTLFWTVTDLENNLHEYQCYYNKIRCHSGRNGTTPIKPGSAEVIDINEYRWQKHCRGLFHIPVAA